MGHLALALVVDAWDNHHMTKRLLVDSIKYLVDTYKVDGFRFDMMGDHDAASIEEAYKAARAIIQTSSCWVKVGEPMLVMKTCLLKLLIKIG